jgi:polyisoprenoid-binding protein YceI
MVGKALLTWMVVTAACGMPAAAEPFVLDKGYTALVFSWSHLGLTRQQARFNGIEGVIDIDLQNPEASKVDVSIRTASVQSGVDTFDRILRSPDYFDATTYPAIAFRSTSVKRTSEVTADVTGELNIRGQNVPVTLAVTLNLFGAHPSGSSNPSYAGKKVAAFSAKGRVLRSAWNMARGAPLVSDEIDIAIETELVSKD